MNDICPFGGELQKYWDKRYQLFSKFDKGIQIDKEGLFSVEAEESANRHAAYVKGKVVVDAFGGIGGSSIAFAKVCKKVFCIEKDKERLEMAKNNAKVYRVEDNIEFILGDFFERAKYTQADVVYLDPPWGGPNYKNKETFKLSDFVPDGRKILGFALDYFDETMLRVPLNFDFQELEFYDRRHNIIDDFVEGELISKTVYFQKSNS